MPERDDIASTPAWADLLDVPRPPHLRELFAADPDRAERYVVTAGDLRIDYSKQRIDDHVLAALLAVAETAGVAARRDAMYAGERINVSEDRAVLHVALRAPAGERIDLDGHDVVPDVHEVLSRMGDFADRVRSGDWLGATGQRIRTVVNIGIGGSDLGPAMAARALDAYRHPDLHARFVSNVDGADIAGALGRPRPGGDAVRRVVEDVHDDRDADERPHRPGLARRRPRRGCRRQALRRRVHQRPGGVGVRHRHGQHVRVLGVGRRSLLDGLGDRAVADGHRRTRALRASCSPASTPWTSTSAPPRRRPTPRCSSA